jgi:ATP-dependent Lon protease
VYLSKWTLKSFFSPGRKIDPRPKITQFQQMTETDSDSDYYPESEEEESDTGSAMEESEGETIHTTSSASTSSSGSTSGDSMADFIVPDSDSSEYEDEDDDEDEDEDEKPLQMRAVSRMVGTLGRGYRVGPIALPCERLSKMLKSLQNRRVEDVELELEKEEDDGGDSRKRKRNPRIAHYTREENDYFYKLPEDEQTAMTSIEESLKINDASSLVNVNMPIRFRLLKSAADINTKRLLMAKLDTVNNMGGHEGDYHKIHSWLQSASRLPLGRFTPLPIQREAGIPAIRNFLELTRSSLDAAVYGHLDSKEQILRILAQWISNPQSRGHCIGIQGAMGTGKSSLVKEGIAKALNLPFSYLALGGAADGGFLEGHSITYEGSTHGKIAEVVMKSGCMNPVIFFDELDKVSDTSKGEEVSNILVHLTDAAQNEHFNDRFFTEIDLDLSKALMVFAFNDESRINPILLDRMTIIRVAGYNAADKQVIARKHLLPSIMDQHGLAHETITFTDAIIKTIMERVPEEKGVRNLRRGLESIISWYNMLQYLPDTDFDLSPPFNITDDFVKKYLKKQTHMSDHVHQSMYM